MTMRKTLSVFIAQLVFVGAVASAPVDVDADMMRTIDDTLKSLDSDVAQKDGKSAADGARDLVETFGKIKAHYAEKPETADAVGFAHHTQELATQALKAIEAKDFDAAADSVSRLARSCKTCHNVYKKD